MDDSCRRLRINHSDACVRVVPTPGNDTTQLATLLSEELFDQNSDRNKDHDKLCQDRTAIFQSDDAGNGHRGQRQRIQKLSCQPVPTLSVARTLARGSKTKCDEGKINLASWKLQELRCVVARTPDVHRIVYHRKGALESSVIPGWLARETLQGPAVLKIC